MVLYFYPKGDALRCTLEAIKFTELQPEFAALDTLILGISKDSCDSHGTLRTSTASMCAYSWIPRGRSVRPMVFGGKRTPAARNARALVDKGSKIRHALYDIKPKDRAARILELIRGL